MSYKDPESEESRALFSDSAKETTMFRVVVKSNLTRTLAMDLLSTVADVLVYLDSLGEGFTKMHNQAPDHIHHKAC